MKLAEDDMSETLVVVSDSASARFFTWTKASEPLHYIGRIEHPEGRQHRGELTSDRSGTSNADASSTPHAYQPHTDPRDVEAEHFARGIAKYVDDEMKNNTKAREVALMMPPRMLGIVRAALSPAAARAVTISVAERLVDQTVEEIARHLKQARDAQPRAPL